jgi:hypothetical protein
MGVDGVVGITFTVEYVVVVLQESQSVTDCEAAVVEIDKNERILDNAGPQGAAVGVMTRRSSLGHNLRFGPKGRIVTVCRYHIFGNPMAGLPAYLNGLT